MFLALSATAQQVTVKGHVKDATGEPVIGANVLEKGTSTGTITDIDGNFTLAVQQGATLAISFVGYITQEVAAAPNMVVTLQDNSQVLGDVVVIGYGRVKKSDATGSVTAMKPDELSKGITTNPQDMLAGKIAGVNVTSNDGTPGGGATIRIRGGSSLNASNDPLIVVDGLALDNQGIKGMGNGLSMVNPDDIETFTVLKDASAAAIYGSRASNGVILITTKKGLSGQAPRVTYSGSVSASITQKRYELLDGDEYRAYANNIWNNNLPSALSEANTDWQDQIFRTAISTDHYVAVSGGFKNMPYRLSFGYTNTDGIIKTSNFERYTVGLNLSPSLFDDHLKFTINAKYMYGKNRYADTGGALGGALSMDPTRPVYSNAPEAEFAGGYYQNMQLAVEEGKPMFSDPAWTYTPNKNTPQNAVAALELKDDQAKSHDVVGSVDMDYRVHFLPDLHVHATFGGEYAQGRQNTVISPYSWGNNYFGWDGYGSQYKYNLSYSVYLQYVKTFGEIHALDVMAGGEESHFHRNGADGVGQGWDYYTNEPNSPQTWAAKEYATRNTLVSYFGRLNYTLRDKYLFTFTLRQDGSSRFAEGNQWGTFPSAAFGWKMKEENGLKDVSWLSELKMRLGWGITGQQDIPTNDFPWQPLFIINDSYAQYPFGDTYYNTSRPNAFNTDLKWESTTTWNVGFDYGFLDGRITGAVDGYYRKTTNMINSEIIGAFTNFNSQLLKNIGSMKNMGLEFSINAKPIVTRDFKWDIGYNVTWNHSEITSLSSGNNPDYYVETGDAISEGNNTKVQAHKVGYAPSGFFVYQQVYDTDGKPIEGMFVDRNADGIINAADKYIYKKPAPDVMMGLTSKFQYKDWDLSFALRANFNNYVYYDFLSDKSNVSTAGLYTNGAYSNTTREAVEQGFVGKTDFFMSDYFVRNASFLRCDNITLGWSFANLFKSGSYQGVNGRLYATVQNPFIVTKYKGLDPEVRSGIDKNPYPRATTFLFGVNLQF
jgi:iron complex outermembrane receptor protein